MATVKLVKSIYTGSDVTSLGELASGDTVDIPTGSTLATPASGILSNCTDLPVSTGVSGLGTGVATALAVNTGSSGAFTTNNAANSFTALQTFTGSSSTAGAKIFDVLEGVTVSATAATGTINYDVTTQAVLYYTSNSSGNFVINLRGSSGTALNTLLATGESVTVAFLVTNSSPAYYNTSVQVDGTTSGVTTRWQGGTAPTSGNTSSVDIYSYTVIKTANATFSVFASQTKFA